MKQSKRLFALLLTLAMTLGMLTACGGGNSDTSSEGDGGESSGSNELTVYTAFPEAEVAYYFNAFEEATGIKVNALRLSAGEMLTRVAAEKDNPQASLMFGGSTDNYIAAVDKGLLERLEHVASSDFGRVTYTEAVAILEQHNDLFDYKVSWGCDLQTEHERYLTEQVYKKPVFVTDYPKEIKAFYMRMNDDGKTVAAADCLVPGIGEIIGGSQREERLDVLEARIQELGMNPEDYWWYCDLRRYGSCRHAGYGLGFERMVMYLTGVSNIRDVELHPRTVGNADF